MSSGKGNSVVAEHVRAMVGIFLKHERLSPSTPIGDLTLGQAYAVQDGFVSELVGTRGTVVGWKVGCTSAAIRRQFGLEQPIAGRLFESELLRDGVDLPIGAYVDCAVEAELYFRLGMDLEGDVSETQARQAIAGVGPGVELHNYRFWYGKPTSQELIASNGIHAGFVMGPEMPWTPDYAINAEEVSVLVNGEVRESASCSEIMGEGPVRSLRWLAKHASVHGRRLRAGEVVIPGSAVSLIRVRAGDRIEARFSTLGSCRVRMI